jgi:hypothetical protein
MHAGRQALLAQSSVTGSLTHTCMSPCCASFPTLSRLLLLCCVDTGVQGTLAGFSGGGQNHAAASQHERGGEAGKDVSEA